MSYRGKPQGRGGYQPRSQQWQNWREPEEHYQDQPAQKPQFNRKQKKPPAKSSRDKVRSEAFRERVGEKVMKDVVAKDIKDKLFMGFEDQKEAILQMAESFRKNPKLIPVSTRGTGFLLQSIYKSIHLTTRNRPDCTIYEAYRVTLAQTELKLLENEQKQVHPQIGVFT
jgi:hypothetical protein